MSDDEHPELDFDPLDATKILLREQFPFLPMGKIVLEPRPFELSSRRQSRSPSVREWWSMVWTSRTTSCWSDERFLSDTQRYRIGANYLQVPINKPIGCPVFTGQRHGQMAYEQTLRRISHLAGPPLSVGTNPGRPGNRAAVPFVQAR